MDASKGHSQTFSPLDLRVLFLEKRIKNNTPSIEDCKCLTLKWDLFFHSKEISYYKETFRAEI